MAFKDIAAWFGANFRSDVVSDNDGNVRVNSAGNIVVRHAGLDRIFTPPTVVSNVTAKGQPAGVHISITDTGNNVVIGPGLRVNDEDFGDFTFDLGSSGLTINPGSGSVPLGMASGETFTNDASYAIYLEGDSTDTLPVTAFLAKSAAGGYTTPGFHTGYDRKVRVGWCKNSATVNRLVKQRQVGQEVLFLDPDVELLPNTDPMTTGFSAHTAYGLPPKTVEAKIKFSNVNAPNMNYGQEVANAGATGGVEFVNAANSTYVYIVDMPCDQIDISNTKLWLRAANTANATFVPIGYTDRFENK